MTTRSSSESGRAFAADEGPALQIVLNLYCGRTDDNASKML